MIRKFVYTKAAYFFVHLPVFFTSIVIFKITRKTPWFSYWSMRKLFYFKGYNFRNFDKFLSDKKFEMPTGQSIFECDRRAINDFVDQAELNGFCILPFKLPGNYSDYLLELAGKLNCSARTLNATKNPIGLQRKTQSAMFDFSERDLRGDKIVQKIASDPLVLEIAARYLKAKPINDLVAMWWSFPLAGEDLSKVAQLYHSDLDRIRFIKFFFHLTDVTEDSGPHRYIKGSHRNMPSALRKDGRHLDEDVFKSFKKEDEVIFTVPKGSILIEDTSGLHKGTPLKSGNRLMFQLEFSSSWYGQSYI